MWDKQTNVLGLILAAGQGKRMNSSRPKVLQPLGGKAMIFHLLESLSAANVDRQAVVYGFQGEVLREGVCVHYPEISWVEQKEQLGTGHAVLQAMAAIKQSDLTLILLGDAPLISIQTIERLLNQAGESGFALLSAVVENPSGYGRVLRDEQGQVCGIVEDKDASEAQRQIQEINTGLMAVNSRWLEIYLPQLRNDNAQQEYYLTDLIAMVHKDGHPVISVVAEDWRETAGINNRLQLAQAEAFYREKQAEKLMVAGATLIDPARVDVHGEVFVGRDVIIGPNVFFKGKVTLGDGVCVESGCVLSDCQVGAQTTIFANSIIESADIGAQAQVGPFARIRPKTILAERAKVGNFVEIKAATVGEGSKVNHLSYIGDATLGRDVNIGAGTITCNYDGANKFQTVMEDNVFIGSNSALVAPVTIGAGATIGAGSVITKTVDAEALALTRAKVKVKANWVRPKKKS